MAEAGDAPLVARAVAAIDAANAVDPVSIEFGGAVRPKEVVHAERMTHWLGVLDPDAGAAQQIAARAHHLRRWALPRAEFPEGRAGYLRWRLVQRKRQVAELSELLASVDCPDDVTEQVLAIVAKKGLDTDPAVQTHEDALCLVFLELQVDDLAAQLDRSHMVEVLRKSLAKMSAHGVATASTVPMSAAAQDLVREAAAGPGPG